MTFRTKLCGLGAALFPSLLMAAALTVTVKDPSGAMVGGAAVTVTPPRGPALPQKQTDVQGRAVFDGLSAGAYRVSVAKQSFDEYKGQVTVGAQPATLVVSLKLSTLTTSVKVSGGRSPLANSDPNYIALRNSKLGQVRQVENFTLTRDAGTFTFRSGSFSFEPAVMGHLTVAAFVGEGNFHLKPASNLAAQHLHRMTGADEVSEDFTALVIYFTDSTADEIKEHSEEADESAQKQQQALKRVNAILQTRRVQQVPLISTSSRGLAPAVVSHPLTQLERLLNYQDIPNYDAEVLTELYNNEKPGSFRAFIHGKKHADLRFLLNPHGALPVLQTPEEVALLNFDPASNATPSHDSDGLWYLSHTVAEVEAGRDSSTEEKRLIAPDHYKIDSFIRGENLLGNRPDLQVVCAMRFHALQDGVRMVKFDLVPDLQVQRLTFNKAEIPFVQESRGHDGSFYLQMPEPLMTGRSYDIAFEYKGGEILQSDVPGGVPLRRVWYPTPSGPASRATYDLTFHIPRADIIVAVGKLVSQSREEGYNVSEWVTDVPIEQAVFRLPGRQGYPEIHTGTDETTGTPMTVYTAFFALNGPTAPSPRSILDQTGQLLRLFGSWFGTTPYGHLSVVEGMGGSLPGLIFASPMALAGSSAVEAPLGFRNMIDESYPGLVARQWWGNLLTPATFHDDWLTAGLVNFSDSLFDTAANNGEYGDHWTQARDALLRASRVGPPVNPAGPVWMGMLNDTAVTPNASYALNNNKGGYVMQMLRAMMWDPQSGDRDFQTMIREFIARFANRSVSTGDFQSVVEKHMKGAMDLGGNHRMDWFFREWLYTTDVPNYRLEYSMQPNEKGGALVTARLTQSNVSPDFRMPVPVFGEFSSGVQRIGVAAMWGNTTREFRVALSARPKRILLNINHDILSAADEAALMKAQ
jgi:hypothetical protein